MYYYPSSESTVAWNYGEGQGSELGGGVLCCCVWPWHVHGLAWSGTLTQHGIAGADFAGPVKSTWTSGANSVTASTTAASIQTVHDATNKFPTWAKGMFGKYLIADPRYARAFCGSIHRQVCWPTRTVVARYWSGVLSLTRIWGCANSYSGANGGFGGNTDYYPLDGNAVIPMCGGKVCVCLNAQRRRDAILVCVDLASDPPVISLLGFLYMFPDTNPSNHPVAAVPLITPCTHT